MNKPGRWVAVAFVLVSAALAIGYVRSQRHVISPQQFAALSTKDRNLAVYDEFVRRLHAHYFDSDVIETPQWQKIFAEFREKAGAAPDSMSLYMGVLFQLAERFPHSHVSASPPPSPALPADPAKQKAAPTREYKPRTFGFDLARIRRNDRDGWTVGDVLAGSAADRNDIEPGWAIGNFSMNATSDTCLIKAGFYRLTPELAIQRERGDAVTLPTSGSVPDQEAAVKTLEENIEYECDFETARKPFETRQLADGITYIRFDNFMDTSVVDKVLAAIDNAIATGLVVDLRHNGGGRTDMMQNVLGRLLGPDEYIGTFRHAKTDWYALNFRTRDDARKYKGPLALIIGPLTGSAAEITAAAVIDNKRGRVVGRWTAGGVLKTREYPLPDGGRCTIPFEDFVRSGGRRIEGVGVAPDVTVMPTLTEVRAGRDVALERAILAIQGDMPGG